MSYPSIRMKWNGAVLRDFKLHTALSAFAMRRCASASIKRRQRDLARARPFDSHARRTSLEDGGSLPARSSAIAVMPADKFRSVVARRARYPERSRVRGDRSAPARRPHGRENTRPSARVDPTVTMGLYTMMERLSESGRSPPSKSSRH